MSSSDDEICVIGETSAKSSREYCDSITDSEKEFTVKRKHHFNNGCDSESSESETNKKKSGPEFYKRRRKEQADKPAESFFIDKKSQPLVEDEFHLCKKSNRVSDKYPSVPVGMRRLKIRDESFIQQEVENTEACPGLEHVTEIRGRSETSYFCGICDKHFYDQKDIISHLKSDKHKLKSLKALRIDLYRILETIPKRKRKQNLNKMLNSIEHEEGIGKIVVEKDYLDAELKARQNLNTLSTSSDSASVVYSSNPNCNLVLSKCSKADYFCLICECNMFDTDLWESHSKKNLQSLKKYPRGKRPKIEVEKRPKSEGFLIDRVTVPYGEPMVGLNYIREFQHLEEKTETYHCMLCGDCKSCIDIEQHLSSLNHRKNYIKRIDHYSLDYVNSLAPNDNRTFYKIEEICRNIQSDFGSGCPEVYAIKDLKEA